MNGNLLLPTLREIGFLDGVSEEHLEKLAEVARLVDFPEQCVIFREGDPATNIFLIVHGNVSLEICAPGVGCRRIMTVGDGDLLGWSPVSDQTRLTATARTINTTQAMEISGGQILTMCEHDPRFGYIFMRRAALSLAKRLSATRIQLLDVFGTQLPSAVEEKE